MGDVAKLGGTSLGHELESIESVDAQLTYTSRGFINAGAPRSRAQR